MKDTWRFGAEELENLTEVLRSGDVAGMSGSANITFENALQNAWVRTTA